MQIGLNTQQKSPNFGMLDLSKVKNVIANRLADSRFSSKDAQTLRDLVNTQKNNTTVNVGIFYNAEKDNFYGKFFGKHLSDEDNKIQQPRWYESPIAFIARLCEEASKKAEMYKQQKVKKR